MPDFPFSFCQKSCSPLADRGWKNIPSYILATEYTYHTDMSFEPIKTTKSSQI